MVIQNGKVTPPYGVATTVQWITAAHADGRAKIVSVEPVANGIVRLDDETEFENPVDRPELGAYAYVNTYDEKYSAPEVLRNSQVTNAKSPKEQSQICHRHRSSNATNMQPTNLRDIHTQACGIHTQVLAMCSKRTRTCECMHLCLSLSASSCTHLPVHPLSCLSVWTGTPMDM